MNKKLLFLLLILITNFTVFSQVANQATPLEVCDDDNDGWHQFNLQLVTPQVLGSQDASAYTVSYHETNADAVSGVNAISGPFNNIIPNSQTIYVRVTENATSNFDTTSLDLIVLLSPIVPFFNNYFICESDQDGFAEFNFDNTVAPQIFTAGQTPADFTLTYHINQADADSGNNPIVNTDNYTNVSNPQTIHIRLESVLNGCYTYGQFDIEVNVAATAINPTPLVACSDVVNGFAQFDLESKTAEITNGQVDAFVTYYENYSDSLSAINSISSPYSNVVSGIQTIYVRVEVVGSVCYSLATFNLIVDNDCNGIFVNAFFDGNNDGIFNTSEVKFTNGFFTYEVNDSGSLTTVSSSTGTFYIPYETDATSYDITFNSYSICFNVTPALFENITVTNGNTVTINFPVIDQTTCEDLDVNLIPSNAPRPGFNYLNDLVIENLGSTTIASGTVTFIHDPIVNYVDATIISPELTETQTATGATINFTNLLPGEIRTVRFILYTPNFVNLGEFATNSAEYTTPVNDSVSSNNFSVVTQEVIGSYDPNDITESHGRDIVYNDFITTDEYLYYTIRFQNVGTAEAINVRIENTVDPLLDLSTLEFLRATHDVVMMQNGNQLTWTFDNIYLPAQSQDDFGSNGYVHFKIKPTAGYAIGTIIPNTAEIYFDFNAAVVTNTFETEFIMENLSVEEFASNDFIIYPNPATSLVNIKLKNALDGNTSVEIIDVQGKVIIQNVLSDALEINVKNLEAGLYFVKLKNNNKQMIKKLIIE